MPEDENATDPPLRATLAEALQEVASYFDELEGESHRAAAILAVAALEDELEALLRSKFPDDISNTKWKLIAGPGTTPFGTLKAKTDVAEAFGFFGPKTRTTINRAAEVRNKFAHRKRVRDFSHPDVLRICREMGDNPIFPYTLVDNPPASDVRWHFIATVKDLTNRLSELRTYIPELNAAPQPLP